MPTTPTSMVNRLMGAETWTDAVALAAGTTIGGQTFDGANRFVTVAAGTTTLTLTAALHANKVVLVQSSGGLAITPAPATGTGNIYQIYVFTAIAGGSLTIDAKAGAAADVFAGALYGGSTGATGGTWITATNSNLITFNATTTGGLAGTNLVMMDVATNKWAVSGVVVSSGTNATPFSNH